MFDIGIENGTVIRGSGRQLLNIYATDGRIAAMSDRQFSARVRHDATGLFVMPGMVDTHVHLMDPFDTAREDFPSGTRAAANAGVTTIIEHTHGRPVRDVAELADKLAYVRHRSHVDFGLAAHAWPDMISAIGPLWRAGISYFKVFTCTTHGVPGFSAGDLREVFYEAASIGAICLVHCEDESITQKLEAQLRAKGRDDPGVIPAWRHPDAELVALSVVTRLAALSGARTATAHLSSPAAVAIVAQAQTEGARVYGETCPQYLTMNADEILAEGALRKFTPPARAVVPNDLTTMWAALADGRINHIASDHAPSTVAQKRAGTIWDVHFGLPGLDTTMPILLDAAARGVITYERLVEVYAEHPAAVYGLAPRKGRLEVGADADVIVVDPGEAWTITRSSIHSKAGWSPFEGRTVTGRTVRTFLRGHLIAEHGHVDDPKTGRFIAGTGLSR